jgi:hypothetical protein
MWRLLSGVLAAVLLGAAPASADQVALRDAPRAADVALSGDEVVVARTTARGGVRVIAIPRSGGAVRTLLAVAAPAPDLSPDVELSASQGVVAAIVSYDLGNRERIALYSGPPAGPLTLRRFVRSALGRWLPVGIDADADRVLLGEVRIGRRIDGRVRVLAPGAPLEPVAWDGPLFEAALAGERLAFWGARRGASRGGLFVIAPRTGAVEAFARMRPNEDVGEDDVDAAPDGRAVAAVDGRLLTVAPGVPPARFGSGFSRPRFSGPGLAALHERPVDVRTPVIAEDGAVRAIGSPSGSLEILEADDRGAAWIANGCVHYAARDSPPPPEPPVGPCPRAEVVYEEGDQVLRGRRLRVIVKCIAAPATGCRGTALLGKGRYGRGAFALPAGARRTISVRLTDRALRHVRRQRERFHDVAFFTLSAQVRDGRAHGVQGIVIDRVWR